MMQSPLARFVNNTRFGYGCWEWEGYVEPIGYSMMSINGRNLRMHRFIYEQLIGQIPAGMQIDHLCRNRRCVRPKHLELVTQKENVLRGCGLSAKNAKKTHCLRGHEFTDGNTKIQITKSGGKQRSCRVCRKAARAVFYEKYGY